MRVIRKMKRLYLIVCLVSFLGCLSAEDAQRRPINEQYIQDPGEEPRDGNQVTEGEGNQKYDGVDGEEHKMEEEQMFRIKDRDNYMNVDSGEIVDEMKEMPDEGNDNIFIEGEYQENEPHKGVDANHGRQHGNDNARTFDDEQIPPKIDDDHEQDYNQPVESQDEKNHPPRYERSDQQERHGEKQGETAQTEDERSYGQNQETEMEGIYNKGGDEQGTGEYRTQNTYDSDDRDREYNQRTESKSVDDKFSSHEQRVEGIQQSDEPIGGEVNFEEMPVEHEEEEFNEHEEQREERRMFEGSVPDHTAEELQYQGQGQHEDSGQHDHHPDHHHHPDQYHHHPDQEHHHPDQDHHHPDQDHHHQDHRQDQQQRDQQQEHQQQQQQQQQHQKTDDSQPNVYQRDGTGEYNDGEDRMYDDMDRQYDEQNKEGTGEDYQATHDHMDEEKHHEEKQHYEPEYKDTMPPDDQGRQREYDTWEHGENVQVQETGEQLNEDQQQQQQYMQYDEQQERQTQQGNEYYEDGGNDGENLHESSDQMRQEHIEPDMEAEAASPQEPDANYAYRRTIEEIELERKLEEDERKRREDEFFAEEARQKEEARRESERKEKSKAKFASLPPPNIVIFLARNVEMGDLGCYGNRTARTPNIDSIASRGVLLSHHMAAGFTDTSSRAAILTGRVPLRYGMASAGISDEIETLASKAGIPADEVTLAEHLESKNYQTAFLGVWNLGMSCDSIDDRCHHPNTQGFGRFFGLPLLNKYSIPESAPQNDYIKRPLVIFVIITLMSIFLRKLLGSVAVIMIIIASLAFGGWSYFCYKNPQLWSNCLMRDGEVTEQPVNWETATERIVKEGQAYLSGKRSNNWHPKLLVVSLPQVHPFLKASKEFRGKEKKGSRRDQMEELDWAVGELLNTLRVQGMESNTLVYFTSTTHRQVSDMDVLRQQLVPGLLSWPGVLPEAAVVSTVTSQMDMVPTLTHFAKGSLEKSRTYDGKNIADILIGEEKSDARGRFIPQYCGEDLWSITFIPSGGHRGYMGYFFIPVWNSEPLYCSSPGGSQTQLTQKTPERIYIVYQQSTVMSPLSPVDFDYKEALDSIQRSRHLHLTQVKAGENQFTWYKQSWHAYLQPYCADGQLVCKDSTA